MSDTITPSALESDKKQIERSVSYPGISLEAALTFISEIAKSFITGQTVTREDVAAVLNTKAHNVVREVAACAQFGLLEKLKDGYKLTDLYKNYKNYLNDSERRDFLITMYKTPKLFSELIEKYNGHVIPAELKTILIRFHKIAEKAAPDVADLFVENGKFAGVINDSGILNIDAKFVKAPDVVVLDSGKQEEPETVKDESPVTPQKLLSEITEGERIKIRLSENKYAYLIYPFNISSKDIGIIAKQLEVIELSIQ